MKKLLARNKTFVSNFLSLSFLQGTNYLIPLIVFPYLIRVLGIDSYGMYALVQAVLLYFGMVIAYGFRLTATDKIAKNTGDEEMVKEVFWNTIYTKITLCFSCFTILLLSSLFIPAVEKNILFFIAGFIMLFGQLLIPDFYFLGKQKMAFITIATTIGKTIYAIMIFTLVLNSEHILQAIIANGIGVAIIGMISFYFAIRELKYQFVAPSISKIIQELREGLYVFISFISVSFYSTINIVLLGAFTNTTIVGYYSITEKIYKSLSALVATPFNMSVYPKMSKWYVDNRALYKIRVKQMLGVLLLVFSFMGIALFFFAEPIVSFLVKSPEVGEIEIMTKLVKIVSIALVLNPFGAFFTQQFIIKDRKKIMLQIILLLGVINIALVLLFIPNIFLVVWAIVINRVLAVILNGYFSIKE